MENAKLIIVSGDSHATLPPEVWPEYLEPEYRHLIPDAAADKADTHAIMDVFCVFPPDVLEVIDTDGIWDSGRSGATGSLDRRIIEMDREGIAAELTYPSDPQSVIPFYNNPLGRDYPRDAIAAGTRAYHRWAYDCFGSEADRILLVGDPGEAVDIEAMTAELEWTASHDFTGAFVPGTNLRSDLPPIYDAYFDPFWSMCEDFGMPVVFHAGYGSPPDEIANLVKDIKKFQGAETAMEILDAFNYNREAIFSKSAMRPRRAAWQMMLGGVFDRHPKLKLVLSEVRGDWMPATLKHLDAAFEQARDEVPAKRRPSEYFASNCFCVLSFVHKAEVGLRHEIGVDKIGFGRDYPHPEGMWPNTADWLSDAFADVPEDDLRLMLGENAVRFLGLERAKLAEIADRIGPTVDDVTGRTLDLDPRMLASWDARGGYLKPPEHVNISAVDEFLLADLADLAQRSGAGR